MAAKKGRADFVHLLLTARANIEAASKVISLKLP